MNQRKRSGLSIMKRLIVLVKPLTPIMLLAIALGTIGFLCAIFITITAGEALYRGLQGESVTNLIVILIIIAFARGFLHYGEQYCNHYIAFRILAIIRHKVFAKLRVLAPARLEGRDKGDLVTMITSDIELLEVFYAHTISPIAIAFLTSLIMVIFLLIHNIAAGIIALCAYLFVGICIPVRNGKKNKDEGMSHRSSFSDLNSYVLSSMYGLDETIQYGDGQKRADEINWQSRELGGLQKKLSNHEASSRSFTNLSIEISDVIMLVAMLIQVMYGKADFHAMLLCTITMMSSFVPVTALSNLSNSLTQTLASGGKSAQSSG